MTISSLFQKSSALALGLALLLPSAAFAAPGDAATPAAEETEIVVTAQRREERSRDVPIAVANLGTEQIRTANINQISDIARIAPALRFDSAGTFVQPGIRGVGTAVTTSGGGPNVGIYVDGFYVANPESAAFDLMRVKSIQVLKGPQGTLFGRNTTGGAILVTSADPSFEPSTEIRVGYGKYNAQTYQAYVTAGLGGSVAFDAEAQLRQGDGYFTNKITNDKKVGSYRNWSARGGLKINFSPDVSALIRYTHAETNDPTLQLVNAYVDQGGTSGFLRRVSPATQTALYGGSSTVGRPLVYGFAPASTLSTRPGEVAINPGAPVSFVNKSDTIQGTLKADLGFANLTSYTQYRTDSAVNKGDLDATAIHLFNILLGIENRTFTQEFLLTSKAGPKLQWTAGLYYFQNRDTYIVSAAFGPAPPFLPFGGSSTNTKSYAGFVDLTYEVSPNLFLTAGARYSHDLVTDASFNTNFTTTSYEDANGNQVSTIGLPPQTPIPVNDLKNDRVTPRFVIRYKPSEQSSIYASYTKGYKAGILNVGGLSKVPIKPEDIDSFEAGYKFDDNHLAIDLSAYYYTYKNLQVSSFQNGAAKITNAAQSRIYGLEGALRYRFSEAFDINASAAWNHARYKSFPGAPFYSYCDPAVPAVACGAIGPGSLTQTINNSSDYEMQRAPDFTANLGAGWHTPLAGGKFTLSGNLYLTSKFYFDPSRQFLQPAYEVLAARAQWVDDSGRFSLAVFGDNLTNKRYMNQVLFNTLGIGAVWAAPTTWGVQAGVKF